MEGGCGGGVGKERGPRAHTHSVTVGRPDGHFDDLGQVLDLGRRL